MSIVIKPLLNIVNDSYAVVNLLEATGPATALSYYFAIHERNMQPYRQAMMSYSKELNTYNNLVNEKC